MNTNCPLEACQFAKVASTPTLLFQLLIIAASVGIIGYLWSQKKWVLLKRFGLIAVGILIFELFTQPLWNNHFMSAWAYLYVDVSWILTLGWTLIIFGAWVFVDECLKPFKEVVQFFYTLLIAAIGGLIGEALVLALGIRTYAPEVQEVISGFTPLLNLPLESFFYIPLFMALVLSFVKYWELIINKIPLAPYYNLVHWKSVLIAFIGVFLYEVMNEPAVGNVGWPEWSYLYHDVNAIRIVLWVILLGIGGHLIQKFFYRHTPFVQFGIALLLLTLFIIPVENFLLVNGLRQYGETLQAGFYGMLIPGTQLPGEILVAIPLYLTLMIAFIRYWTAVWDGEL